MANPSNEQSPLERDQNACIVIDETKVRHFDETETATSFSVKDNRVLSQSIGGACQTNSQSLPKYLAAVMLNVLQMYC